MLILPPQQPGRALIGAGITPLRQNFAQPTVCQGLRCGESATRVSLLMGSEPLFGAAIAGFWLGERLGLQGWIGGLLIVSATVCALCASPRPKPLAASPAASA